MISYLYIDNDLIGTISFKIIDEGMGAIGGELIPSDLYGKYKKQIQALCEKYGIANIEHLNFKIILENGTTLNPEGGIGVTDIPQFEEIEVEAPGLDIASIKKLLL
jgi:hypothetical protein